MSTEAQVQVRPEMPEVSAPAVVSAAPREAVQPLRRDVWVFLLLVVVTFSMSAHFELFSKGHYPNHEHLGAEYFSIAQALVQGRGFADPFEMQSGPTSWMPPLYSLVLAGVIAVLEEKRLVVLVIAGLSNFALAFVGAAIHRLTRSHCVRVPAWLAVVLYVAWLVAFHSAYFMLSHDIWFVALVSTSCALIVSRYCTSGRLNPWIWGVAGGLAASSSPAFAVAWGVLTLRLAVKKSAERRQFAVALAVSAALAAPWAARNVWVFERFIPTKSNLPYDAYQANCIDDDGVYGEGSFWQHPFVSLPNRLEYAELGEPAFIDKYGAAFRASVERAPLRFLSRVANRALAATLAYPAPDHTERQGLGVVLRSTSYALPFLAMLVAWLVRGKDELAWCLRSLYLVYLVPYALFAFYPRHLLALTGILVFMIVMGLERAVSLRRPRAPTQGKTLSVA